MATFADLSHCTYFGAENTDRILAVGWLERDSVFATGTVERGFYDRLVNLMAVAFQPMVFMGLHQCELCQFDGPSGGANLFVPSDGVLHIAPELIVHYIAQHHYLPPKEFQLAVAACPDPQTMEYRKAFLNNGGRALIRKVD